MVELCTQNTVMSHWLLIRFFFLQVRVLVIILIAVFNTESTPIFETFSEVSKSIKGYFQSTIDMVDNADSYIIDLVKTGNHAVDRSVLHTASFLKQLTFGTASELTFATYHSLCKYFWYVFFFLIFIIIRFYLFLRVIVFDFWFG